MDLPTRIWVSVSKLKNDSDEEAYFIIISCFIVLSCSEDNISPKEIDTNRCSIATTVRDYTGLEGCGFVLELKDRTILEPVRMVVCGPPPQNMMTLDNPLLNLEEYGKEVLINYEPMQSVSTCMVGQAVKYPAYRRQA
jgi:hypothetical protein